MPRASAHGRQATHFSLRDRVDTLGPTNKPGCGTWPRAMPEVAQPAGPRVTERLRRAQG